MLGKILSSTADFTMDLCTDSNRDEDRMREICSTGSKDDILWVRKSSVLGINHEYALRQIVTRRWKEDQGPWKNIWTALRRHGTLGSCHERSYFEEFISTEEVQ